MNMRLNFIVVEFLIRLSEKGNVKLNIYGNKLIELDRALFEKCPFIMQF